MGSASNKAGGIGVRRINEMSLAYQQAGVLWAGIELELFTRISQGATTLGEIANAVGAKPEAIERLLAACVALELLEKKDGAYSNPPDVENPYSRQRWIHDGLLDSGAVPSVLKRA